MEAILISPWHRVNGIVRRPRPEIGLIARFDSNGEKRAKVLYAFSGFQYIPIDRALVVIR
jgi:predicted GNAT family acetyltransferase